MIEFLESPKGPPYNWRYQLRICPQVYDEQQQQGADDKPPAQVPPRPPRGNTATAAATGGDGGAGAGRVFAVELCSADTELPLPISPGAACSLRVSPQAVALLNAVGTDTVCSWRIETIFDFGVDSAQSTFFLRSNDDSSAGTFHFRSTAPFDILALVRSHAGTSTVSKPARQPSVRPPIAK